MIILGLALTWSVFGLIQYITTGIEKHIFLRKDCYWVFAPFISEILSHIKGQDGLYILIYLYLILIVFSSKRKTIYSMILLFSLIIFSVYAVLFHTPFLGLFLR